MIRCDRATVERAGHVVVEQVTLTVAPGHAAALVGRSGAGKSSLVAAVATALPLHGGDVLVDGRSARRDPAAVRRLAGYVPVRMPEWPGIRAGEFLELFGAAAGLGGPELARAVTRGLELAGLAHGRSTPVDALAAGPSKWLLLARALLLDPQVLLLDDPFAGLDPIERREMERRIADAHLMGRAVLAAVDDADVPPCFTHLAVLSEGRLVAEGPLDPAAFSGRAWRHVVACPGRAADAARALGGIGAEAVALDADTVACRHDPSRAPFAEAIAALVRAGIPVEAARFDPPWPAQLLE